MAAFEGKTAIEIFRIVADGYAEATDEYVTGKIEIAKAFVCAGEFRDNYNFALALYAAHIMTLPGGWGQDTTYASGKMTSVSGDGVSVRFESGSSSKTGIQSTEFGVMFDSLRVRSGAAFGLMTRGPDPVFWPWG